MTLVEEGRVCIKRLGRDAGSKAVITKVIDKNFVNIISKKRPKERRCNVAHLEFLSQKIDANNKEQLKELLEIKEKKTYTSPSETKKK